MPFVERDSLKQLSQLGVVCCPSQACDRKFVTSVQTLRREPHSLLFSMASDRVVQELKLGQDGLPLVGFAGLPLT